MWEAPRAPFGGDHRYPGALIARIAALAVLGERVQKLGEDVRVHQALGVGPSIYQRDLRNRSFDPPIECRKVQDMRPAVG